MINTNSKILTNTTPFTPTLSLVWEKSEDQILYWKQPKRLQGEYILYSTEHILGNLKYDEQHFIRQAIAKTNEGEWLFKYTRLSLPKVTIQKKNSIIAQTIMETNWGWYGTLILPNGNRLSWKSVDESENEYQFTTAERRPLVSFRPRLGFLKIEGDVEIDIAALHNPQLPLLTMLGWFLVLLRLH